jgi:hypothetical protein
MSANDENLKDEHLRKALQHAPDSDVAPSAFTRKTVLDYADKAAKTKPEVRQESWLSRVKNMFNSWQIPRWQLTGMGSLAASLLVVVLIWHENPDDPMQVGTAPDSAQNEATFSTAPKPEPTLAQNELARNQLEKDEASAQSAAAPEAASAEMAATGVPVSKHAPDNSQNKTETKIAESAEPIEQKAKTAPQVAAIEQSADKPVVTSAPEAVVADAEKELSQRARAREQTDALAMPAPVPSAPVVAEVAPASVTSAPVPMKKMSDAEKSEAGNNTDVTSTDLAIAISKQGGKALAKQDIQAGRLRILVLSKPVTTIDDETGYRIELLVDDATNNLATEVAEYNQTMRAWHMEKKQMP